MEWPLKEEILYKNYNGALIAFNEVHQGLLKLHVPLGWGEGSSTEQEKNLQKREFSYKQKLGHWYQGLIQKKVHIDWEKDAQISILAYKIVTQW